MNIKYAELKKYIVPTIVVFVVITLFNMIFHGTIMEKLYAANSHFFRPQDEIHKHKYYLWLANLIYSFAFTYIYSKGHEKKESLTQGIRYGLWISLLIWIPVALVNYTVYPIPKILELYWLAGYTVQSLIAGITVASVFKPSK